MTTLLIFGAILVLIFAGVTLFKKTSRQGKSPAEAHPRARSRDASADSGIAFLPFLFFPGSTDDQGAKDGGSDVNGNGSAGSSGGDADGGGGDGGGGGGGDGGGGGGGGD